MKFFTATRSTMLLTLLSIIGFALGLGLPVSPVLAAEPRFDATYFFQSEDELKEKQINFEVVNSVSVYEIKKIMQQMREILEK